MSISIITDKKSNNRRYYLHQIVRNVGFDCDAHKRTVYVKYNYNNNNRYISELKNKFNYNVQLKIV